MNKLNSFSKKQLRVLSFWRCNQQDYQAIICDGAVRSGKTVSMSISFILWSMFYFNNASFGICGKTITSARRNIITPLLPLLKDMGFSYKDVLSRNYIDIIYKGHSNRYYIFGGKDESSASSIQGITLGGVLFDEVALMPRSFVEQAIARCSLTGSKFWFNCNPEHPYHWFYLEWIKKAKQKNALYLHFTMDDNPSLCPTVKERYRTLYSGAFYERFVLGKWVAVEGIVYSVFQPQTHIVEQLPYSFSEYYISCDYGTVNPTSMGLWGKCADVWYRIREYYYSSKITGEQKTDQQYYTALLKLAGELPISAVIIDPAASSFIACVRSYGKFSVICAKNNVLDGIHYVSDLLLSNQLRIHKSCVDCIREFSLYRWKENGAGDIVCKQDDHSMDDLRYFVMTIVAGRKHMADFFAVGSVNREKEEF